MAGRTKTKKTRPQDNLNCLAKTIVEKELHHYDDLKLGADVMQCIREAAGRCDPAGPEGENPHIKVGLFPVSPMWTASLIY